MQFTPDQNTYTEVTLEEGLIALGSDRADRLYSDGLESDEYIYHSYKGFCYEDHCVIGHEVEDTMDTLISLKWPLNHKFYIKNKE